MKSAVLVIDVQTIVFDVDPQPFETQHVISRINTITAWARKQQKPVIFVQHDQPDTPIAYQSEGWQLYRELVTCEGDLYTRKSTPDSFLNTNLKELLEELGIEKLIVCGYASEFCVDTTVRRAAGLGYPVELVSDAHTTQDKPHANAAVIRAHENSTLSTMSNFGMPICCVSTAELLATPELLTQ